MKVLEKKLYYAILRLLDSEHFKIYSSNISFQEERLTEKRCELCT